VSLGVRNLLHDGIGPCLRNPVSLSELSAVYARSHVALHVEAFDKRNRLASRRSFSTKIIDCLASGCAVLAVAWEKHTGLVYLRDQDAAFWATSEVGLQQLLARIAKNPATIAEYAHKARRCLKTNHDKATIQHGFLQALTRVAEHARIRSVKRQ